MNRLSKKLFSFVLSLVMCVTLVPYAFAAELQPTNYSLLNEYGLDDDIISAMPESYRNELIQALENDPSKVSVSTSVLVVDTLQEIENFMSATDEELLASGAEQESIDRNREKLNEMYNESDAQLENKYGFSTVESKMFRRAIDSGRETNINNTNDSKQGVSASGELASSTMSYATTAYDNSSSSHPVYYSFCCSYSWQSPYFMNLYSDKIVAVWGGSLQESTMSGSASYYFGNSVTGWADSYGIYPMTLDDEAPNSSITFGIEQAKCSDTAENRSGTCGFVLTANSRSGGSSWAITRYGHRALAAGDTSITIGAPSISFGTAYNQTPISSGRVAINY